MKRSLAACAALLLAWTCSGCDPHRTLSSTSGGASLETVAFTPGDVVTLIADRWPIHDATAYRSLLTADFRFVYAPGDSAGSSWRQMPWDVVAESTAVTHLLVGGGASPALSGLRFITVGPLTPTADPRPGHANRWHRLLQVSVEVYGSADSSGVRVGTDAYGMSAFYVVRGDSAHVGAGGTLGPARDSTKWYLERWEDLGGTKYYPTESLGQLRQRWYPSAPVVGSSAAASR